MSDTPLNNGATRYTVTLRLKDARAALDWDWPVLIDEPDARTIDVRGNVLTIQFSNDYPTRDDAAMHEGNPLHWHWADLLDEPDARCTKVEEAPNPTYRDNAVVLALGALRDYDAAQAIVTAEKEAAEEEPNLYREADEHQTDVWENYCDVLADNVRGLLRALGVTP